MRALPPALRPWASQLEGLADAVPQVVGPWLPRLSLAIGRLKASQKREHVEPDGYSGLARRGPYERLLTSEWLFADVDPDEFTRRAAMGEHSFLDLSRVGRGGSRRCTALFDAGPSQLGAPRLVQLALLLVLARRAEEAGTEFFWGVLQSTPRPVKGVQAADVRAFVEARSALEPTEAQVDAWRAAFESEAGDAELWLIGGGLIQRMRAEGDPAVAVLSEPLTDVPRCVNVQLAVPQRPAQALQLTLPAASDCIRALRNPLGETGVVPSPLGATPDGDDLVLLPDERRLVYRTGPGTLGVRFIPNSRNQSSPRPLRLVFPEGEVPIAVGMRGSHFELLTRDGAGLAFREFNKKGGLTTASSRAFRVPQGADKHFSATRPKLRRIYFVGKPGQRTSRVTLTDDGTLYELEAGTMPLLGKMCAVVQWPRAVKVIGYRTQFYSAVWDGGEPGEGWLSSSAQPTWSPRAFLGKSSLLHSTSNKREWTLVEGRREQTLICPPEAVVIGVVEEPSAGMLLLESERRAVAIAGPSAALNLFTLHEPARKVLFSAEAGLIVGMTESRQLFAWSLKRGEWLLRTGDVPEKRA